MLRIVIALIVIGFVTAGQAEDLKPSTPPPQTAQQRVEAVIGGLVVQNAQLQARVDELTNKVNDLTKAAAGKR